MQQELFVEINCYDEFLINHKQREHQQEQRINRNMYTNCDDRSTKANKQQF